jgi:hypothetical protein
MYCILKGQSDEKSVSNKLMQLCFRPPIWTADLLQISLIIPQKDRIFEKLVHCFLPPSSRIVKGLVSWDFDGLFMILS